MSNIVDIEVSKQARIIKVNHLIRYVANIGHQFFKRGLEPQKGDIAGFLWDGEKAKYHDEISQHNFDILDEKNHHLFSHGYTLQTFIVACAKYIESGDLVRLSRTIDACDSLGLWAKKESTAVIVAQWARKNGLYIPPPADKEDEPKRVSAGKIFEALGRLIENLENPHELTDSVVKLHLRLRWKLLELDPSAEYEFDFRSNEEIKAYHIHLAHLICLWYRDHELSKQLLNYVGMEKDMKNTSLGRDSLSQLKTIIECLVVAQWT